METRWCLRPVSTTPRLAPTRIPTSKETRNSSTAVCGLIVSRCRFARAAAVERLRQRRQNPDKSEACGTESDSLQSAGCQILAHDFQRHLLAFYTNRSGTAPPPLEAASWLVLATSPEQRREVFDSCQGLMASALMLVAEALSFAGQDAMAMSFAQEAQLYAETLQRTVPDQFETMVEMFPIREAWAGFQELLAAP
ncbi:unnamed protein product, partial [Symbiodinium necroappetens]